MIFQRHKLLVGWMPRQSVADYIARECTAETQAELAGHMKKWEKAAQVAGSLAKAEAWKHENPEVLEIQPEFQAKLREVAGHPAFKNTIGQVAFDFKTVEIDKLIAAQGAVYTDFIEKKVAELPKHPTQEQLVSFCLSPTRSHSPVSLIRENSGVFTYGSDGIDLRFIGAYSQRVKDMKIPSAVEAGLPVEAIVILVGYGLPVVQVVAANNKLALANGLHRLYALRSIGITHAPVLVHKVQNQAELGWYNTLNLNVMFNNPRPPLLKDYFNPELTIEVQRTPRRRNVKVKIDHQVFDTPL